MTQVGGNDGPGSLSWETVQRILQAGHPVAAVCTGGGNRALSWLFNHPGASRVLVEAQIPYAEQAVDAYLGQPGPHRTQEETARRLAATARCRALRFTGDRAAVGLGATAALATDRDRRGPDHAFIAVRNASAYEFVALQFDRTVGRLEQEEALSLALLSTLARSCGCGADAGEGTSWVTAERHTVQVDTSVEDLLDGNVPIIEIGAADTAILDRAVVLVPGSFDPFHPGHAGLAEAAERRSGRVASFELSVHNVDKPALPYREVMRRAGQQRDGRSLVLTREPTFLGKARVLPGCWFAIGYDTALRLVDPAYYEGRTTGMERALAELGDLGCRFFVAGRQWEGVYRGLQHVPIPSGTAALFESIDEAEFRMDISSTELRER